MLLPLEEPAYGGFEPSNCLCELRGQGAEGLDLEPTPERVSAWGGFDSRRPEVAALALRVGELLRAHLSLNPEVVIVPPKTIPRSEGKAVRVVERRAP